MERLARLGEAHRRGQASVAGFCLLLSLALTALLTGCTRKFYRNQADKEVGHVLEEKDQYPAWKIENYHVYPDPRARFADPTNPDRPPMPPDDPAAWESAPRPQRPGKGGSVSVEGTGYLELLAEWDAENRHREGEAPVEAAGHGSAGASPSPLPSGFASRPDKPDVPEAYDLMARNRPFLVKVEQAVELGLLNSREYQDRREDLYLTALPVTLQRFSFAAQFFATEEAVRERAGRLTAGGPHNRWRLGSETGFTKLFSTGALLLFRLANQTVIDLTGRGPRQTISESTALLELSQPLLRGGGRAVTLEPLTQAERSLLYEIRDYARFRKEFFVSIAGGGDLTRGGVGGFGGLALGPSGAAPIEGYLPVLLRNAQIANERRNAVKFAEFLQMFKEFENLGDIPQVNVDQVEQSLIQARFTAFRSETEYRAALDRFKLQLGVPADLPLELDETPVRPMAEQLRRFEEVREEFEAARMAAEAFERLEPDLAPVFGLLPVLPVAPYPGPLAAAQAAGGPFLAANQLLSGGLFAPHVRRHLHRVATTSAIVQGTQFRRDFERRWGAWEKLGEKALEAKLRPLTLERTRLRMSHADLERAGQPIPEAMQRRLGELESEVGLGLLETFLRDYEKHPWRDQPDLSRRQLIHATLFRRVINQFVQVLGDARSERVERVRHSWPVLPPVCVNELDLLEAELEQAQAAVAQTALINRLDLMNQRALLTDAWRKIAVFANSLLGTFNVQYHLDTATPPGQAKPLAFSGSRSRHQLILNAELPLVRQNERNNYRASLIAYQRSRRALMEAEDSVVASVRQQVRQLRLLAENYRIQQRLVELAYSQVEQSLETFRQPPTPPGGLVVGPPGAGGGGAGNAAALTQQLVGAQRSLPQTQNQLLSIWINFQVARMQLYRDLEFLPLDFRGVWNDEHASCCGPDRPGDDGRPAERRDGRETGEPERLPNPRQQPPAVRTPLQ